MKTLQSVSEFACRKSLVKRCTLVFSLLIAGLVSAIQADDFANDANSILEALKVPSKQSTVDADGFVVKSLTIPLTQTDTDVPAVRVMEEVTDKGVTTRAFGVVPRQEDTPRVNLKIEFAHDSAQVRPESYALLDSLASAMRSPELANETLAINGHTDSSGNDDYNLALSFRRADSVRDYLVTQSGISRDQLTVLGFGEGVPLVTNDSSGNRQLNRRVEVERVQLVRALNLLGWARSSDLLMFFKNR